MMDRKTVLWTAIIFVVFTGLFFLDGYLDLTIHPYIRSAKWRWQTVFSQHCFAIALSNGVYWPPFVVAGMMAAFFFCFIQIK